MSEKNYASKTIFQHRKKMLILAIRHNQTFARLNIFSTDLFQRWYKWIIFHIKTAPFLLKISAKSHKGVKILEYCSFNIFKEINKSPSTVGTENPARRDYLCLSESWPQCETTSAEDGAPAALSFMLAIPSQWMVMGFDCAASTCRDEFSPFKGNLHRSQPAFRHDFSPTFFLKHILEQIEVNTWQMKYNLYLRQNGKSHQW